MKINHEFTDASEGSDILGSYTEMEKYLYTWINFIYGTDNFFNQCQFGEASTKEIRDLINKIRNKTTLDSNLNVMYNKIVPPAFISKVGQDKNFYEDTNTTYLRRKNRYFFTADRTTIKHRNMLLVDKANDMRIGFSESNVSFAINVVMFTQSKNAADKLINKLSHSSESLPGDPQMIDVERLLRCSTYADNNLSGKAPINNDIFTGTYASFLPKQMEDRIFRDFLIDRPMLDKSLLDTFEGKKYIVDNYMSSYSNGRLRYLRDDMTNRDGRLAFEAYLDGYYTYDINTDGTSQVDGADPILCSVVMTVNVVLHIPSIIHYYKTYNNLSGSVFTSEEIDMIIKRLDNIEASEANPTGVFTKEFHIRENMEYLNLYLDNKITTENMGMSDDDVLRQQDIMVAAMRLIKNKATNDGAPSILIGENRFYNYFKNELTTTSDSINVNVALLAGTTLNDVIEKDGKELKLSTLVEFDMRNAKRIENIKKIGKKFKELGFYNGGTWWRVEGVMASTEYKRKRYKLAGTDEYIEDIFIDKSTDKDLLFDTKVYVDFYRDENELSSRRFVVDPSNGDVYMNDYYASSILVIVSYLQIF